MNSATSEKIIRSLDFSGDDHGSALRTAEFHTGLVDDYIRQAYGLKPGYEVEHTMDSPGNHTYTIRKGSSEVVIETNFGMNTTYGPGGPRNFYTLNLEAKHRNRALDTTAEINDLLVWGARAAFAVLFAIPLTFVSLAIGSQVHSAKVPALLVFGSLALAVGLAASSATLLRTGFSTPAKSISTAVARLTNYGKTGTHSARRSR